jgi:hypothetical protein
MDAKGKTWAVAIGCAVAGAVIAGGVVWFVQADRIAELETELERSASDSQAATSQARIEDLEQKLAEMTELSETTTASVASAEDDAEGTGDGADEAADVATSTSEDGRHFAYIASSTWESDGAKLTVDYAQMLTGSAAAAAASAAGDESPPPNDYYIANTNPKLRTFPVKTSIKVRMTSTADGTRPDGYDMPFGQWYDAYSGMSGSFPAIREVPYWITVQNGTITKIEEQYLP